MIDVDQDNSLDADEIENMAAQLDIKLTKEEVQTAMWEMDAGKEGGVSFEVFTNWWLSSSKVAAKVKAAASAKGNVAKKIFGKLRADTIQVEDLVQNGRNAFGEPVSQQQARAIIDECAEKAKDGDSTQITEAVFEHWWTSDLHHATRLRQQRRQDMMMVRRIVEAFDSAKKNEDDYKAHRHAEMDADEFEEMIRKLKLGTTVRNIIDAIASVAGSEAVEDGVVDFNEFFDWMQSDNELAERVKKAFVLKDEKDKKSSEQPFPFIPWVSVKCRDVVYSWRFEGVMTFIILVNTIMMAMSHHEQEITSPGLSASLATADLIFSFIYVLEFIIKLLGMGAWAYFASHGNKFDFICSAAFVAGYFMPDLSGASAFRSLRVLIKCMRVARSAKMLLRQESVQALLKTVLENGGQLFMLGMFAVFMMVVFTIIGGHTLGHCHVNPDGTALTDEELAQLPDKNFFTFGAAFHSIFLIMTAEEWAGIMYDYAECSGSAWIYFMVCFCVMNFFV